MRWILAALLLAGCPDVAGQCRDVLDDERAALGDEIAKKVADGLREVLPFAVDNEMMRFGCVGTDAGTWSCAGSSLCEGAK